MDWQEKRAEMVRETLAARGINDQALLNAFLKVPRERFVPPEYIRDAYGDFPLPIGFGQTISQPYIVALMLEALSLKKSDRVLEIGTGSGYQTALIAELASFVYSVERIPELAQKAEKILKEIGYNNVLIHIGDGTLGWPEYAPFDAVVVSAAAQKPVKTLLDQLAEGGRLVIPVGNWGEQELIFYQKKGGRITSQNLGGCRFVPLIGEEGWPPETIL